MNGLGRAHFWSALRRVFSRELPARAPEQSRHAGLVATLCVLGALLIWFLLTMSDRHTAEIEVPTEIISLPPGEALIAPPPATVRVEVEGEGFELLQLFFDQPTIAIPATSNEVDLNDVLPRLPGGVTRRSVTPRYLYLQTDRRVSQRVPVSLRATFDLPSTYALAGPVRYFPDSVTVTGAARVVEALRAWPTQARRYTNLRDTLRAEVPLSDTLAGYVTVSGDVVAFEVPVAEFTGAEREIDVRLRGVPSNERVVSLAPRTVRVRFRVLLSQYREAMNAADFFATVSYDDIRQDNTGRLRPAINLPEGLVIQDVEVTPPTVGYYNVLAGQ